jgi:hypothetical protein
MAEKDFIRIQFPVGQEPAVLTLASEQCSDEKCELSPASSIERNIRASPSSAFISATQSGIKKTSFLSHFFFTSLSFDQRAFWAREIAARPAADIFLRPARDPLPTSPPSLRSVFFAFLSSLICRSMSRTMSLKSIYVVAPSGAIIIQVAI